MTKKITWSDLNNASFSELKKTYKLSDSQLEMGVRRHLDGASAQERRDVYGKVWKDPNKR